MKNIALIPARGGSKRLPLKNIKELKGKPLIAYTIEVCLESEDIDRVIVSTDHPEIARIAKTYGAEAPFTRPAHLAGDEAHDRAVMLHLINWLKEQENVSFDALWYMRPTSPFKDVAMITEAARKLENSKYSAIRSVTRAEGVFHPYWMFRRQNGELKTFIEGVKLEKYHQRQLLPECYRINGMIDVTRVATVLEHDNIYGERIGMIEIEEKKAVDIDTEMDFLICECLLEKGVV